MKAEEIHGSINMNLPETKDRGLQASGLSSGLHLAIPVLCFCLAVTACKNGEVNPAGVVNKQSAFKPNIQDLRKLSGTLQQSQSLLKRATGIADDGSRDAQGNKNVSKTSPSGSAKTLHLAEKTLAHAETIVDDLHDILVVLETDPLLSETNWIDAEIIHTQVETTLSDLQAAIAHSKTTLDDSQTTLKLSGLTLNHSQTTLNDSKTAVTNTQMTLSSLGLLVLDIQTSLNDLQWILAILQGRYAGLEKLLVNLQTHKNKLTLTLGRLKRSMTNSPQMKTNP